jgi:predicted permease
MRLWKKVRIWAGRRKFEAELVEEIRLHRELSGEAAFGSVALTLEESREVWGFAWLESWKHDLKYALRGLRRSPGFALGVVAAIGLGIGLNTTLFTVFNAYALRPFVLRDPYSLYRFTWYAKTGNWHNFTRAQFEAVRGRDTGLSDVLASMGTLLQVEGRELQGQLVSGNYFSMLGVGMALGRPLLPEDDGTVLVLGYDAWRNKFGGDPGIVGRKVHLRGQAFEVVGVVNPAFGGLEDMPNGFWLPLAAAPRVLEGPDPLGSGKAAWLNLIGRLRPGVTAKAAQAPLLACVREFAPEAVGVAMVSRATTIALTRDVILTFIPLFTAFALVLLIACANVSNMMLARALARQREVAIRVSLGAPRWRLIRQLLTESVLLAAPAAVAGFAISEVTLRTARWAMFATMPVSFARMVAVVDLAPDWRVFGFILAAAVATALLFGLVPAVQTTRARVVEANRGDFSSDYRPARLRNALVVAQVATCALLLISTAVVLRSERRFTAHPIGIDAHEVWDIETTPRFLKVVAQRLPGQPGVEAVASAVHAPLLGGSRVVVVPSGSKQRGTVKDNFVSPGYFSVLRIPVRRGRVFTETEAESDAPLVLVSESTARRFWPGRDAVGETLAIPPPVGQEAGYMLPHAATVQVIGVVADVRSGITRNNDEDTGVYFPFRQGLQGAVLVRMQGEPGDARRRLEAVLDGIAPSLADAVVAMEDVVALLVYPFRVTSWVAGFLAGVALLLTVTGIYGVMSYLVSQRTKEIGIRLALGASGWNVVRMVVRQCGWLAGGGAVVGVGLALAIAPVFAHQLEAIQPYDWVPYAGTAAVVVAAALAASWGPARRAVGVDPVRTLRCD